MPISESCHVQEFVMEISQSLGQSLRLVRRAAQFVRCLPMRREDRAVCSSVLAGSWSGTTPLSMSTCVSALCHGLKPDRRLSVPALSPVCVGLSHRGQPHPSTVCLESEKRAKSVRSKDEPRIPVRTRHRCGRHASMYKYCIRFGSWDKCRQTATTCPSGLETIRSCHSRLHNDLHPH